MSVETQVKYIALHYHNRVSVWSDKKFGYCPFPDYPKIDHVALINEDQEHR
jgi:hypothetical protein